MNHRFRFNRESRERIRDYARGGDGKQDGAPQETAQAPVTSPTEAQVSEKLVEAARAEEASREPITVTVRTDIGRVRASNQDAVIHAGTLCGVADGMGGHQGGEIASAFTRDTLVAQLEGQEPEMAALTRAVKAVNRRLFLRAQEEGPQGMGTTLSVIWLGREGAFIAHVGDSRVYLLREGHLRQVTDDHSMVMEMVRAGVLTSEQAANHPMRNVITRAIGTESGVDVDCIMEPRRKGDLWLICSDGLHGMVPDARMEELLRSHAQEEAADLLLQAALDAGGHDNVSFVLVYDREGAQ